MRLHFRWRMDNAGSTPFSWPPKQHSGDAEVPFSRTTTSPNANPLALASVSYTHLDVYKRQSLICSNMASRSESLIGRSTTVDMTPDYKFSDWTNMGGVLLSFWTRRPDRMPDVNPHASTMPILRKSPFQGSCFQLTNLPEGSQASISWPPLQFGGGYSNRKRIASVW